MIVLHMVKSDDDDDDASGPFCELEHRTNRVGNPSERLEEIGVILSICLLAAAVATCDLAMADKKADMKSINAEVKAAKEGLATVKTQLEALIAMAEADKK